jgi:hypothetical protein
LKFPKKVVSLRGAFGERASNLRNDLALTALREWFLGPVVSLQPRQLGTLKGTVRYLAPDFDAPLEDFKEYLE